MKTVFFESLRYKLITKNDFYYGSCPDIHFMTPILKRNISCSNSKTITHSKGFSLQIGETPLEYVI